MKIARLLLVLAANFAFATSLLQFNFWDSPEQMKQRVKLFFSPNPIDIIETPMANLPKLYYDKAFNVSARTMIYFHGWQAEQDISSVITLRHPYVDYNVIAVDWSAYSKDIRYSTKVIPKLKEVS
jgi:hypothetical protein